MANQRYRTTAVISLLLALFTITVTGCGKSEPDKAGGMNPAQVTVTELQPRSLPVRFEYVGRLEASREIEIRPRVTGLIEQRLFKEGGRVKAGQHLFRIDPAPFAARRRAAEAALAEAKARYAQAEREAKRLAPLAEARAVSQRELDDANSNRELNKATVAAAEAALTQARLELGYTDVVAPIAGRIGRALEVEGALVSPTSGPLATLAQVDPLYVRFSISGDERLALERQIAAGRLVMPPPEQSQVEVQLADGTLYPISGHFYFNDYRSDPQTGAFGARATLPNPDTRLNPGQFVRVRVEGGVLPDALAVPQRAVQEDARGKFVYVATKGEHGMTAALPKHVEVGQWVEQTTADGATERLWVIESGLAAGDQVVTDGTARIFFPGMPIQPQAPGTAAGGATVSAPTAPAAGDH
jgi:membrane fusion protein, multidrug efflux system